MHLAAVMRIAIGLAASVIVASALAPAALGECPAFNRPPDQTLNVGYAFLATVVEASDDVDPPQRGNTAYMWHVELRVDHVYTGRVPRHLVFNGWDVGCHSIRGDYLRTGDRIFVAIENLGLRALPTEPFSGDTVVWRWADGRWHYARNLVGVPEYPADEFLPPAIGRAATTADIVAIIRAAQPPDTSTSQGSKPEPVPPGGPSWALLAPVGLLGLLVSMHRSKRVQHT
jgi:hypothetical protein